MGKNNMNRLFVCHKGKQNLGQRQKPFAGAKERPRSGPYFLVLLTNAQNTGFKIFNRPGVAKDVLQTPPPLIY